MDGIEVSQRLAAGECRSLASLVIIGRYCESRRLSGCGRNCNIPPRGVEPLGAHQALPQLSFSLARPLWNPFPRPLFVSVTDTFVSRRGRERWREPGSVSAGRNPLVSGDQINKPSREVMVPAAGTRAGRPTGAPKGRRTHVARPRRTFGPRSGTGTSSGSDRVRRPARRPVARRRARRRPNGP